MSEYGDRVRTVIGDYVKPNGTLATMSQIHFRFTGENQEFTRWEKVQKKYIKREWDENKWEDFLEVCREVVEGDIEEISKAYLDILEPEEISPEIVVESFQSHSTKNDSGMQREGFEIKDGGENIRGIYYYFNKEVEITVDPTDLEEIPIQKRIYFEIDTDRRLIIIDSTQTAQVGKLKSEINDKTIMNVAITGNLNLVSDEAEERVKSFINSFEQKREENE